MSREQFEKAMLDSGEFSPQEISAKGADGGYLVPEVIYAWRSWQLREAIEPDEKPAPAYREVVLAAVTWYASGALSAWVFWLLFLNK